MSMVLNNLGRRYSSKSTHRITLELNTYNILCRYILQDPRLIRMEHLVNLRKLLDIIDRSTYENNPDIIKRVDFLYKALEARLNYNLTDLDLILTHINGGINFKVDFLDYDNISMDRSNINYCHRIVEDTLKYAFFYSKCDELQDIITQFKSADVGNRTSIIKSAESVVDDIKNQFRKTHIEENINDVFFSLSDDVFDSAVTDTYNMITNPSRRLYTGMQGLNQMIGGGFESGRVYMFLGVAGVGKSITLLNLVNQMKKYNLAVRPKDPTKTPCIVLLTMENTVVETITRLFDMVVDNSKGMGNYDLEDVIYKMKNEGGLCINESSPLDIVIKYKPNRSVSTDYLYSLYDDVLDMGKEPVCVIQDHIKRIRSIDGSQDLRIELGDIVNEFKVFAAEKDIPVITVSHLNREATRILEETAKKGNNTDSGKLLGKSNIGESLLMVDNLDCGITLAKDYDKDGNVYMTFHRIKMRDKGSTFDYMAQPFLIDNPIRLVEDIGILPQYKESLHAVKLNNNTSVKMSGVMSNNDAIIEGLGNDNDNLFINKQAFNLSPVSVNDNDEFIKENEEFDADISNLILETAANQQQIFSNIQEPIEYPSDKPIIQAITIGEKFEMELKPIVLKPVG